MAEQDAVTDVITGIFGQPVPHVAELGIAVVETGEQSVIMRLPYQPQLIGNPDGGILHGGAVTTLIDTACGFVAIGSQPEPRVAATLDLRIDYLRPAEAERDLLVHAHCYHLTRRIAFVRATAYQDDPERPVAAALCTFMIAETAVRPAESVGG